MNKKPDMAAVKMLDALRKNGAQGIPSLDEIMQATAGTKYHGVKKNGQGRWFIIKHDTESYNAEF